MGKILSSMFLTLMLASCDFLSSGIREHCREFMFNWASNGFNQYQIRNSYVRDRHGKVIASELSCLSADLTDYHGGSFGGMVNYDTLTADPAYMEEMLALRNAWIIGDDEFPPWRK